MQVIQQKQKDIQAFNEISELLSQASNNGRKAAGELFVTRLEILAAKIRFEQATTEESVSLLLNEVERINAELYLA